MQSVAFRCLQRAVRADVFPAKVFSPVNNVIRYTSMLHDNLFGISEELQDFRHGVQSFVKAEIEPLAVAIDSADYFGDVKVLWRKLGEMGLLGLTAPTEYGGMNLGYLAQCIAIEELSYASGSIGLSYGAHSNLCVNQLVRHASPEQAKKYLPKLISGEYVGALAMSEVNAGSDVLSMQTKAERVGNEFVLNGSKFWITNAPDADVIIVYAKTDNQTARPKDAISAFIVETKSPGFSIGQKIKKLGMRGSHTAEILFDNCRIPADNLLGPLNGGVYVLMSGLDLERLVLAAGPVGLMRAACDLAFDYAQVRKTFGQPIGEHGMVMAKMADMFTRLQTSRSYLYTVAQHVDRSKGKLDQKASVTTMDCSGVILYCAEAATKVALDAIQILGGNGYTEEYPVGRILRDAKLYEIGAGTSEIRRMVIARGLNSLYKS